MSFRDSVRTVFGWSAADLAPPDLVSFRGAAVRAVTRHYRLTEPYFDGANWHQIPARFLGVSGSYRREGVRP